MERIFSFFLSLVLAASCAACGSPTNSDAAPLPENGAGSSAVSGSDQSSGVQNTPEGNTGAETGGRVLVAYFSATGTTRDVAETLAQSLNADLFEILPEQPYTAADLDYNSDCRANAEQQDETARPTIASGCVVENWASYDVVLLGHPIWWGIPPKIMRTFAESYDWSGKTVVGFCTSGGSAYSNTGLPELTEGAVWLEGRRFSGAVSPDDIAGWAEDLHLHAADAQAAGQLQVSFNGHTYTASLADNTSAAAFAALLAENGGSLTIQAHDYGGFEKVGVLPASLPQNDEPIDAAAGDLILYQGNNIVLYYSTNSWTFTRLGRLEGDLSALEADLGEGNVEITYSLAG